MKDNLYSKPGDPLVKFTFDKHVADVFTDMIGRSVPGYATTIAMIGVLADQYAKDGTNCYDLGSSLGAATIAMRKHISSKVQIIAVDNSADMINNAESIIKKDHSSIPVHFECRDIRDVSIENASVVVMNFTLQFLKPVFRDNMIDNIYRGLNPGGILILSEKIHFDDNKTQATQIKWHHAFKKANDYSDLEIAQKRTALEKVLIPETEIENIERLKLAGFKTVHKWFQCFNFISLVGQK